MAWERIERELSLLLERAQQPSVGLKLALRTSLLEHALPELLPLVGQAQNQFHARLLGPYPRLRGRRTCWHDRYPLGGGCCTISASHRAPSHTQNEQASFGLVMNRSALSLAEQVAARLRFSKARREAVRTLVATHMLHPSPERGDAAIRRLLRKVGTDRLDAFLALKRADITAKGTPDVPQLIEGVVEIEERLRAELARRRSWRAKIWRLTAQPFVRRSGAPPALAGSGLVGAAGLGS